jgi:hypothetical protein
LRSFVVVSLVLATAASSAGAAVAPRLQPPHGLAAAASPVRDATGTLGARRLASTAWNGGTFTTAAGAVTVYVSTAYAADNSVAQQWASFFASLVHGSELSLLNAYFAPLDQVRALCGGADGVLGCYENDRLVAVGETVDGITPESVAAHEYGHHVAFNRVNAPWQAVAWGTKRWATAERVCARVAGGTAFPGDEGDGYRLDPGEAFAESFRVLNETRAGAPATWPLLDPSFMPDASALQAVYDDVVSPWTVPPATAIHGRLARGAWTRSIPTPLDGTVTLTLTGASTALQLLGDDGRTVVQRGAWTTAGGQRIALTLCGQRSLRVRVVGGPGAHSFTLRVARP